MIDNVSRLELLRMSREMVINEHVDRRAELHNKWVNESEELWKTKRQRLAYPSIPPYPTEKDILERAKALLDFISDTPTTEIKSVNPEKSNSIVEEDKTQLDTVTEKLETVNEQVETKVEPSKSIEINPIEYAKLKVERDLDINSTAAGRVLPISLKKFFRSNNE